MKRLIAAFAAALLLSAGPASAQVAKYLPNDSSIYPQSVTPTNGLPVNCVSGCTGGGGAATSANQTSQITQETTTATGVGAPGDTACASDNGSCSAIALIKRNNQNITTLNTTAGAALAAGGNNIGSVNAGNTGGCGSVIPISQTTSTDLHTTSGKGYICSIVLVVPDAEVVSVVEGTGTVCATGIAAVLGATTAANGMSFAANGGFSAISGFPWLQTQTSNDHLCLLQSGSGRISGVITYNDH